MKQRRNLKTILVAGAAMVALCMAASVQAQGMQQGKGVVRKIKGSATYTTAGGATTPLKVGDVLVPGTTVNAGAESSVDINLDVNGPILRVTADTSVALDTLSFSGSGSDVVIETKLNLQDGRILGSVKKTAAASKYEVKTPTGVAGIRGTDYDIRTHKKNGKQETVYICVNGSIVGADSQATGNPQPFNLADHQGFGPGGPFEITPADLALINDILREAGLSVGIEFIPGGPGGGLGTIVIHIAPANPGKVDLSYTGH